MKKQKILLVIGISILVIVAVLYLTIKMSSAKITTFEECEKAGWLVREIKLYDYSLYVPGSVEKECILWVGKSFMKYN
jgi:hypothetical protein